MKFHVYFAQNEFNRCCTLTQWQLLSGKLIAVKVSRVSGDSNRRAAKKHIPFHRKLSNTFLS